jgi:hypothetical protein
MLRKTAYIHSQPMRIGTQSRQKTTVVPGVHKNVRHATTRQPEAQLCVRMHMPEHALSNDSHQSLLRSRCFSSREIVPFRVARDGLDRQPDSSHSGRAGGAKGAYAHQNQQGGVTFHQNLSTRTHRGAMKKIFFTRCCLRTEVGASRSAERRA